jgi:hypothetical protein
VKGALAVADGGKELLAQGIDIGVVGQLEVVDTRHDTRKVVVRREVTFAGLAHDCEHGFQISEALSNSLLAMAVYKSEAILVELTSNG